MKGREQAESHHGLRAVAVDQPSLDRSEYARFDAGDHEGDAEQRGRPHELALQLGYVEVEGMHDQAAGQHVDDDAAGDDVPAVEDLAVSIRKARLTSGVFLQKPPMPTNSRTARIGAMPVGLNRNR